MIDIDSPEPARFDHEDVAGLEEFAVILASFFADRRGKGSFDDKFNT